MERASMSGIDPNAPVGAAPEGTAPEDRPVEFVQSLERGLAVIQAFSADTPRLSLTEVARATDLTRAAARRFLITLETLGYVGSDGRHFFLRPRVLKLGYSYLSSMSIGEIAEPHLAAAARDLQESCSASVLDDGDIVYVARAATKRIMSINLTVGSTLAARNTSMGRVLLAGLPEAPLGAYLAAHVPAGERAALRDEIEHVREQGWCLIDQELEIGVRSVSVPIHDASGQVVVAINSSAHASRVSIEELATTFLDRLRRTAADIESNMHLRS